MPLQLLGDTGLTALLVENDLSLKLPTLIQRDLHLRGEALAGLAAVQKVTHAAFLHQLSAGEAGQFTEAIRAVDDGIKGLDLSVPQDKIAVWMWKENRKISKQMRGSNQFPLCFTWLTGITHINAEKKGGVGGDSMLGMSNQRMETIAATVDGFRSLSFSNLCPLANAL